MGTSLKPLVSLHFMLSLLGLETEGLLDFQGRAGITSIVRWNLRPVIFGVDFGLRYGNPMGSRSILSASFLAMLNRRDPN